MNKKNNEYTLRVETQENIKRYYVSFIGGDRKRVETEISEAIAEEMFVNFSRVERNQKRYDERHRSNLDFNEENIYIAIAKGEVTLDETIAINCTKEKLINAISKLTQLQKRRLILRYFYNLKLEKISEIEKCSFQTVDRSIKKAEKAIKRHLKYTEL